MSGPFLNRFTIMGETSELSRVRYWLAHTVRTCCVEEVTEQQVSEVELALQEALTNVISHALGAGTPQRIDVTMSYEQAKLQVEVSYRGATFDESLVAAPSFDGTRDHGFGLFMMMNLMDEVEHGQRDDGRCFIRMVKKLNGLQER